ncbi:hypothetical protein K501DRAFT_196368, partial [Backusella circina FSU 941]
MGNTIPKGKSRGLKTHTVNNKVLIEFIVEDEATCNLVTEQEFVIGEITLKATRTLPADSELVTLRLRDLPFDEPVELVTGLTSALGNYGKVLKVSLHHEIHGGFFLGTVIAIIDTTEPIDPEDFENNLVDTIKKPTYKPFDHMLTYNNSKVLIEWNKMPLSCRYCHEKGHAVAHCPTRDAPQCWNCGEKGHVSYNCPLKQQQNSRKKP